MEYIIKVNEKNEIIYLAYTFDYGKDDIFITQEEYEKAKCYRKFNPITREFSERLQDNSLDQLKNKKNVESKEKLSEWLLDNPIYSKVHNPEGAYYSVTQEKQTQLTQMITLYNLAVVSGIPFTPTWNSTGGVCEEWSIQELNALCFEITAYVLPRVKKQQLYELEIAKCETYEQLEEINIDYTEV